MEAFRSCLVKNTLKKPRRYLCKRITLGLPSQNFKSYVAWDPVKKGNVFKIIEGLQQEKLWTYNQIKKSMI
jgi:hypothetical protein